MFTWERLGWIFNPAEHRDGFIKDFAQAPSTIVLEDRVRVFFCGRPAPDPDGGVRSRLSYLDLDRKDLRRVIDIAKAPVCSLGALGTFDEFGTYPASVVKVGKETRAYHGGFTRCVSVPFNAAIGVALSEDDGKSFVKAGDGPVLEYAPDEPFVHGSPKIRRFGDTWYLWYCSGRKWLEAGGEQQPVYKIRMATSQDGYHWKRTGRNLLPDVLEPDECQASADVFLLDGVYHMLFSFRYCLRFKEKDRGYRFGYAWSKDLLNWTRDDAQAGMQVSSRGLDSESVSYGHVFFIDGEYYMLYQGNEIGKVGFGLVKMVGRHHP
jgi:predicted GH43/DUF377 family glycosyl hydrolase